VSDEYEAGRCVIGERAHGADVGLLCRGHLEKLGAILRDIEDQAAMLDARPSMQIRTGSGKGSLASERAPARLDVLVHTDRRRGTGKSETDDDALAAGETLPILDVLHSWARIVREERDLADPETVTVTGERDVLSRHLEWVAEQAWVDEAYGDLRKLLGQLKGSNGTQDDKPVGRCYLPADVGECGGPIWVDMAAGHAHCGRCKEVWDGPQLAMLSWELERARRPKDENGEPLWTAQEVATKHRVKVGTIAVWAHRLGVVSTGGYYDPRLFPDKASA
jgi:hypothetical protein